MDSYIIKLYSFDWAIEESFTFYIPILTPTILLFILYMPSLVHHSAFTKMYLFTVLFKLFQEFPLVVEKNMSART